jgi:hypothetical protein
LAQPESVQEVAIVKRLATVLFALVILGGLLELVQGIAIWTGAFPEIVPIHVGIGLGLALALWVLAFLGVLTGVPVSLIVLGLVWGVLMPALGEAQAGLLPGGAHWVIEVLHLLVGLAGIALALASSQAVRRRAGAQRAAG